MQHWALFFKGFSFGVRFREGYADGKLALLGVAVLLSFAAKEAKRRKDKVGGLLGRFLLSSLVSGIGPFSFVFWLEICAFARNFQTKKVAR